MLTNVIYMKNEMLKKMIAYFAVCCMVFCLTACGSGLSTEVQTEEQALTEEEALASIQSYCFEQNPELEKETDSEETTVYWDVSTNDAGEIVVLFRSYTGSETRYYIDPVSGDTYSTELVPGIIDEEQRTDESFNTRDYLK
jgi:hypothetical protein